MWLEQEDNRVTQTGKTRLILVKMQISLHLENIMVLQLCILDIAL